MRRLALPSAPGAVRVAFVAALATDHDLDNGDGGPVLSELIRADGARRAQLRAAGDARDVELLAIDSEHGPRPYRVAVGARPAAAADTTATSGTTSTTAGGDER